MTAVEGAIAWYSDECDPNLASVRLRMLQPMRELAAAGVGVARYDPAADAGAWRALVFCKCLTRKGLEVARRARQSGLRIVYDICDNVYEVSPTPKQRRRMEVMSGFLELADDVVFSTEALRQQILLRHPDIAGRSRVIPDMLESMQPPAGGPGLIGGWRLSRLRRFLGRHGAALHAVWFGNNMGKLSGLVHVDAAMRELETFSAVRPVTLTVISNDAPLYRAARHNWRIPSHYLPWSLATFALALAQHDVAIVPVERNAYTQGKTINRPATAILAGLGVVGDAIESYEPLRPYIHLDDWQAGLAHYAATPPRADPRLAAARRLLTESYGDAAVAALWRQLLEHDPRNDSRA